VLAADLFVDCSGFSALLIGKHFGVPFVPKKDVLFIDKAWAVQVPYSTDEAAIHSTTVATAQSAGWVWDIGLTTRRGVGYVFSSGHVSEEGALEELKGYLSARGDLSRELSFRKIDINSGYRREFWTRNCVAVGLSAGFLEPLEASAIVMIELSAKSIANLLPSCRAGMPQAARIFNDTFRYRWERIIDFLKLHYVLSRREDSRFWVDNRRAESIPESLRESLEFWRSHSPWHEDSRIVKSVLGGELPIHSLRMGFQASTAPWLLNDGDRTLAGNKASEAAQYASLWPRSCPPTANCCRRCGATACRKSDESAGRRFRRPVLRSADGRGGRRPADGGGFEPRLALPPNRRRARRAEPCI
jgi:hypothetical protein